MRVSTSGRDAGSSYREQDATIFLVVRFLMETATQAQAVAIGWSVYQLSGSPLALGLVGLAQFLPMALLMLPAGELCDRVEPRRVLATGLAFQALCAAALLVLAVLPGARLSAILLVVLLAGASRALSEPAGPALLPLLVPPDRLPRVIAASSSVWQVAVIAGPAAGGLAYGLGAGGAYGGCCAGFLAAACGVMAVKGRRRPPVSAATLGGRIERIGEGIRFVRSNPLLLGAISLDLVAVLLGGATALLPVYARDILKAGPIGLGLLRSAPAVGACLIALYQTRRPPERGAGRTLFAAVAAFGLATVLFAFSTSMVLSLAALFLVGASDMVSVNIRSSLVQLATPDALRGRVSALNMLFVGTSAELGAFESGVVASLIGTVPSVAVGGVGALIAVVVWAAFFPALRRADRLVPVDSWQTDER